MSGRFPKCPNPECRRFLFKRLNNDFLCGGCKQTFKAEDLIKLDQKSSSNELVRNSFSGDEPQPLINSPSYSTGNKTYPNLLDRLNKTNPNHTKKGSNSKGSFSSSSSVSSEETTIEQEQTQNGRNSDESFLPINKMLYGNYEGSVSSRSLSSDESGSTIHRNPHAMSRRTHKREVSKDSNLRYGSNFEGDETKPVSYETIYPQKEPNIMNLNVNKMELHDNTGFEEEIEEREYEKFGLYSSRINLNPSFDRDDTKRPHNNSRNDERSYKYYSNDELEEEESKSNHSLKLSQTKKDTKPTERNFLQNPRSVRSSVISDEDFEEEEESKTIINESNYSLHRSKIDQKPTERNFLQTPGSVRSSIISEEDIEERESDLTFNRNFVYSRGGKNSNANSFDGSASSRSFSSDEGTVSGTRIGTGDSRFKSKRTHRSNASIDERTSSATYSSTELNAVEKPSNRNNIPNPNHQTELNDVVNELAKYGVTREKLIMLLLKQTDNNNNNNNNNQNRNQRVLMRKLSFTPAIETPRSTEFEITNRGKRNSLKHHCRPVFNGTPFVICQSCSVLLHLPMGLVKKELIKIRCGDCNETHVYRFPAKNGPYNPLHKQMGYESARLLMMPSRQFSVMSDDDIM